MGSRCCSLANYSATARLRPTERYAHLAADPVREAAERVAAGIAAGDGGASGRCCDARPTVTQQEPRRRGEAARRASVWAQRLTPDLGGEVPDTVLMEDRR